MLRFALFAGLSGPAIVFGLVVPVVIFFAIFLFFKLLVFLFRTIRDKRLERAYLAEKRARAESEEKRPKDE